MPIRTEIPTEMSLQGCTTFREETATALQGLGCNVEARVLQIVMVRRHAESALEVNWTAQDSQRLRYCGDPVAAL
jgi:hypothetical protein